MMPESPVKISEIGTKELIQKCQRTRHEIPWKDFAQRGGAMTIAYMKRHRFRKGGSGEGGVKRMPPIPGMLTTRDATAGLMGSVHQRIEKINPASSYQSRVGSPKDYAAIHEFSGMAGRGRKSFIPKRPYLIFSAKKIEENWRGICRNLLLRKLQQLRLI